MYYEIMNRDNISESWRLARCGSPTLLQPAICSKYDPSYWTNRFTLGFTEALYSNTVLMAAYSNIVFGGVAPSTPVTLSLLELQRALQ